MPSTKYLYIGSLCGRDEELLGQGLELNDSLQSVLAKHDKIASGSPLPPQVTSVNPHLAEIHDTSLRPSEVTKQSSTQNAKPSALVVTVTQSLIFGEEEDDFARLARRSFSIYLFRISLYTISYSNARSASIFYYHNYMLAHNIVGNLS